MASEDRTDEFVMRTPRSKPIGVTSFASWRALSGLELIVGTLIVLGHNVFRVLPTGFVDTVGVAALFFGLS